MTEFSIWEWCDYARGLAPESRKQKMDREIATGDPDARRAFGALTQVVEMARAEREECPPDYAVRGVKAMFAVGRPEGAGLWRRLEAALTFDSDLEPLPAGTRSIGSGERELHFQAENIVVDLRVDRLEGRGAAIVGEIVEDPTQRRPLARVPLVATHGGEILGHAISGEFGEFHIETSAAVLPSALSAVLDDQRLFNARLADRDTTDEGVDHA